MTVTDSGARSVTDDGRAVAGLSPALSALDTLGVGAECCVDTANAQRGLGPAGVDSREGVLESGYSTDEEKTGSGLSIVWTIAEAHGWERTITDSETET